MDGSIQIQDTICYENIQNKNICFSILKSFKIKENDTVVFTQNLIKFPKDENISLAVLLCI